jgi:hypothetical protein
MHVLRNNDYTDDIWEYFDPTVKFIDFQEIHVLQAGDSLIIRYNKKVYETLETLPNSSTFVIILYGFPSVDEKTDIGDHFLFTRKQSLHEGVQRYSNEFCQYIPELPFITQYIDNDHDKSSSSSSSSIGIAIDSEWNSQLIYVKLQALVSEIMNMYSDVIIHFICIDTDNNAEMIRNLQQHFSNSVYFEYTRHNTSEMLQYINNLDYVISGNYYISILSMHVGIPTISLSTGDMCYLETDLNGFHLTLPNNGDGVSVCNIPIYEVLKAISMIHKDNHTHLYTELYSNVYTDLKNTGNTIENTENIIGDTWDIVGIGSTGDIGTIDKNVFDNQDYKFIKRSTPPYYISSKDREDLVTSIIDTISSSSNEKQKLLAGDRLIIRNPDDKTVRNIVSEILWMITGDPHGFMFKDIASDLLIGPFNVLLHKYTSIFAKVSKKRDNILNSSCFNGEILIDTSGIIIDMYTEKTFKWNKDFYMKKGIIPFKTPWIGYIHHEYEFDKLQNNPLFIESLKVCKHIVKVFNVCKPIYTPAFGFTLQRFHENRRKYLINITSNPSNVSDFYEIHVSEKSWVHSKCITKSIQPAMYSLPLIAQEDQPIQLTGNEIMYETMIYKIIKKLLNNVTIIETIDSHHLSELLSNNIVFIEYIETSLVMFDIITCIIRNTPVILIKNSVTVSLLGENYPLYYNAQANIETYLTNTDYIDEAYMYLLNLDKTPFTHTYFSKYMSRLCTI